MTTDPTPASPHEGLAVVVAMLTYQRLDDLRAALPAFLAEADRVTADVSLLVVDNDPAGTAAPVVEGFGDARVRYVHEPRPGIAAGRNRALAEVTDADVLIFVDDDERPCDGWLTALLGTYVASGHACVVGAVVSEFESAPDPWIAAGRFFDRRRLPTGTEVDVAATNNLLLDLAQVRRAGVTFDERFGLSGGSDTLFTRTLVRRGVRFVWCDEAVVVDSVPAARITRDWVLKRARRSGNSASRTELELAEGTPARVRARAEYVARGLVRVAGGSARTLAGAALRSPVHDAKGRRSVQRGLGMITGALGHVVFEYRRAA